MPDRRGSGGWRRLLGISLALLVALASPALAAGGLPFAPDRGAPNRGAPVLGAEAPGASCPDTTPAPGSTGVICEDVIPVSGGGAGIDLAGLLPFLAAAVVGGAIALVVAFLVLRRRVPPPLAPAGPGEWWTCSSCGATNISGAPRCYSCGAWQG